MHGFPENFMHHHFPPLLLLLILYTLHTHQETPTRPQPPDPWHPDRSATAPLHFPTHTTNLWHPHTGARTGARPPMPYPLPTTPHTHRMANVMQRIRNQKSIGHPVKVLLNPENLTARFFTGSPATLRQTLKIQYLYYAVVFIV